MVRRKFFSSPWEGCSGLSRSILGFAYGKETQQFDLVDLDETNGRFSNACWLSCQIDHKTILQVRFSSVKCRLLQMDISQGTFQVIPVADNRVMRTGQCLVNIYPSEVLQIGGLESS